VLLPACGPIGGILPLVPTKVCYKPVENFRSRAVIAAPSSRMPGTLAFLKNWKLGFGMFPPVMTGIWPRVNRGGQYRSD
jgi:hypothetical protein